MKKLLILIVVLAFATSASASIWNGGDTDGLWVTAGNWYSGGAPPTSTDTADLWKVGAGIEQDILIDSSDYAGPGQVWYKMNAYSVTVKGTLETHGGSAGRINMGYNGAKGGTQKLIVDGGLVADAVNSSIYVGYTSHSTYGAGHGLLEVKNGGVVDFYEIYLGKQNDGSTGHLELGEGTVDLYRIFFNPAGGSDGSINITEGTLILDLDKTGDVTNWVTDGWLTAYGGSGTIVSDYNNKVGGHTTIWAIPEPMTIALLGLGGLALVRRKR
jgi:hypothetical protein